MEPVTTRGSAARVAVWAFHLALPLLGLWLLLSQPSLDIVWEHHGTHFWLVLLAAALLIWLAALVDRAARRHGDVRLLMLALGYQAAAAFLGLHALATPGLLLSGRNAGFDLATPVGLVLAAVFVGASAVDLPPAAAQAVLKRARWLRAGLLVVVLAWGVASLANLPPLADPLFVEQARTQLLVVAALATGLYVAAAVRYYLLYRRRRAVMLLSIVTANVLLAEAMVAVALAPNWRLSWWEWHLLFLAAFGYLAYSTYVQYGREGATAGLFDAVGTEDTAREVRAEYGAALETLVTAIRRQEAGELSEAEMTLITAGLASQVGLTEGQTAVLGRAAAALGSERELGGRLNALVAVGNESRVRLAEDELLRRAVRRVGEGFQRDGVRVGLLTEGRLEFPAELCTDTGWHVEPGTKRSAEAALEGMEPVSSDGGLLSVPLTVKDRPAGVLLARRSAAGEGGGGGGYGERDQALLASLASQLSIGLENARLYHQLDGLFRQYMSPDVATALLADPAQAALGGAVVEVTAVFADLRGFTGFSERSSPQEVVTVLNRYFEIATAEILAEGGTVVQFIGDALMALFNAPARQPDHALRAARSALAMQAGVEEVAAANEGWPRFRVGVNTGEALVGNIGSTDLRSFNAMGDAVNVAARLEGVAEPGQVVIGESTYRQLGDAADVEPLGELTVKGREAAVTAYVLSEVRDG